MSTSRVEFIEYVEPKGRTFDLENNTAGNAHISIVTDSIEEDYKNLTKQGIKFACKPINYVSEGSTVDGMKIAYFQDPEGRTIELMQFLEKE